MEGLVPKKFILTLAIGITFGFSFAYMLLNASAYPGTGDYLARTQQIEELTHAHSHGDMEGLAGPDQPVVFHSPDEDAHKGEGLVAAQLAKDVRVLCWVMTNPGNHEKKAKHVKATWGKRCNTLLFMSSEKDPNLPTIALDVNEGRDNLWAKTKAAYKYVYENHFDDADWFMKADDDTYVIVENLRYMLQQYDPKEPIYFGCKFKPYIKQGYMSGGAGYVLSKEALSRFAQRGIPDESGLICRKGHKGAEDVEMGKCMENLKVKAGDSRDSLGRGRFFPFVPEHHLVPGYLSKTNWFWQYIYYPMEEGMGCCSDSAVSFHYVGPNQMYVMEYLLYHLRPYGIDSSLRPLLPGMKEAIAQVSTTVSDTERRGKGDGDNKEEVSSNSQENKEQQEEDEKKS